MTGDEAQIRQLIADRETAIAKGDARAAVATTADGSIAYDLAPPLAILFEHDSSVKDLDAWFTTWRGSVTSELHDSTVLISGDLAVVHGLSNMRGDKKGEGPIDLWFRSTVVLERRAEGWRIIHEHSSVPMAMDGSVRAMTELKPE